MTHDGLTGLFAKNAEAVSAVVKPMARLEQAMSHAVSLARGLGGPMLAAPGWEPAASDQLGGLCREAGLDLQTKNLRQRPNEIAVGFTKAQYGVAETGTLVIESASEDLRLTTMLSQVHVAVLRRSDIHPDMQSLQEALTRRMTRPPSYMAFITGASRTADIERVLAIGVHGPVELHILLIGEAA